MQSVLPSPQSATGVFQNLIVLYHLSGSSRWYFAHEPASILFMKGHAFGLTGVSPKISACCA